MCSDKREPVILDRSEFEKLRSLWFGLEAVTESMKDEDGNICGSEDAVNLFFMLRPICDQFYHAFEEVIGPRSTRGRRTARFHGFTVREKECA